MAVDNFISFYKQRTYEKIGGKFKNRWLNLAMTFLILLISIFNKCSLPIVSVIGMDDLCIMYYYMAVVSNLGYKIRF